MKNWKTTVLGILGAAIVLATSKRWIDQEIAAFVGALIVALFGTIATDSSINLIGGSTPPPSKDEK